MTTKALLDYEHKLKEIRHEKEHELRMEELKFIRATDEIRHQKELERQRIKTAEIRKNYERKMATQYPR